MSDVNHQSAAGVTANSIGKVELAELLGWTRPRLDKRLETDASFPVIRRRRGPGGYQFDPAAVAAYLGVTLPTRETGTPSPSDVLSSIAMPSMAGEQFALRNSAELAGGARHQGEVTARQRRDQAQASMLEDKLRRQRGELVDRAEMEMIVSTMLAHLGKGLDGLPDMVVKRLGLPEERSDAIRALTDDLRVKMVNDLRSLFKDADA